MIEQLEGRGLYIRYHCGCHGGEAMGRYRVCCAFELSFSATAFVVKIKSDRK